MSTTDGPELEASVEQALTRLTDGVGPAAVAEIVSTWLVDVPGLTAELRAAAAAGDRAVVARLAHRAKSTAALFGAQSISGAAAQVEGLAEADTGSLELPAAVLAADLEAFAAALAARQA